MAAAIERHDGTLMASVYAARPSAAAIAQGEAALGPDAIRARYAPWDTASAWTGRVVWDDRRLEPLGPDAILATATFTWSQEGPDGKRVEVPGAVWTGVLVREGPRWALLHEHESFKP
jgi:ketosteroid isomerase-like protein